MLCIDFGDEHELVGAFFLSHLDKKETTTLSTRKKKLKKETITNSIWFNFQHDIRLQKARACGCIVQCSSFTFIIINLIKSSIFSELAD